MSLDLQEQSNTRTLMKPDYIYASSLVKTRENKLLSDTQLEMLLSSKSLEELELALQDTYLAPYLSGKSARSVSIALEASVKYARELLEKVAPKSDLLNILWIKYDFYNLKTIVKGVRNKQSDEEILENCFSAGIFDPKKILVGYQNTELYKVDKRLAEAVKNLSGDATGIKIEETIQQAYFSTIGEMAKTSHNSFLQRYVKKLINVFNVLSYLRVMARIEYDTTLTHLFVEGGSFTPRELQSTDDALALLKKLGNEKAWQEAIEDYVKTGNFSLLEKASDEHLLDFLNEESFELFTLAPLYAYFTAIKNNAQTIRAIVVGKETGMSERDIRFNLRRLYK